MTASFPTFVAAPDATSSQSSTRLAADTASSRRSRRTFLSGAVGLCAALLVAAEASAEPARRWPLWPTEVARAAEPLVGAPESELRLVRDSRRVAAVRDLDVFATPLVAPILVAALEDRSSAVRREVLQACLERQLLACAPAARKIWQTELDDPALRVAALRVAVLAADADRLQLFLTALRDPDALIRAESMRTFAAASWPKDQLAIVRTNLIAKLADPTPEVRRAAAHGLGVLGPDDPRGNRSDGALPLTRLLVDPDPQVRQDTADALARLRDPRAAPALLRALQVGDETYVGRSLLHAFAALPGTAAATAGKPGDGPDGLDVDAELLRLLDAPPRNLLPRHVAEAIARRRMPSAALAEGLVARLREDALRHSEAHALRQPALDALLGLGEAARPALTAALARGLEPPLEREVRRLLAALDPPQRAAVFAPPWPADADRDAWQRALTEPDPAARLRAAAALGQRAPEWLGGAAGYRLELAGGAELRRPWLLALASAPGWTAVDSALPVRLALWADDPSLGSGDRCLAVVALARQRHGSATFARVAAQQASAADPAVRVCTAAALAWAPPRAADPLLAGLLRDASARVRTSAALALACRDRPDPEFTPQLALMAARDPEPAVVRAVELARVPERCDGWGVVFAPPGETGPWLSLRLRGRAFEAPAETLGTLRLAFGPGYTEATLRDPAGPPTETTSPRIVFD
ncbi:HEAT repeat domain-containing protein [Nannocystis punicea]|uniref:HEAT repeat domain-containing protein n=1 Tax=Nannocystis punicea TaxID=2995304 RepID=A0ABY7HI21_9BACT|nr:HEAT repeat domain-containing protein [Nannocystis poenicansa]WAS98918.1 HEAT repeat domain-containing protein [Nannocystis poenicansa]